MSATIIESDTQTGGFPVFYLIAITFIVLYVVYYLQSFTRVSQLAEKIPGPPGLPFIGFALHGFLEPQGVFAFGLALGKRYGDVIKGWLCGRLFVFLLRAKDVEVILNSSVHIDKSVDYRFFKPWLGDGLLISTGEKWKNHRKLIAPTFHLNVLKSFVGIFNKNSRSIVERMEKEIGKTFDVHDYMSTATVDILIETAMGIKKTHQDNAGFEYAVAVMKMCYIIHKRMYRVWLWIESLYQYTPSGKTQKKLLNTIHSLTSTVIREKKALFEQNKSILSEEIPKPKMEETENKIKKVQEKKKEEKGPFIRDDLDDDDDVGEKKRKAFLDLMVEQQFESKLTDEEIKEEVDTIMFEGHDTTAAGSSFVLCMLGLYQHIQDKVYQEIYDIFGDSDRPITFADTLELKYLERVILETLRLYPPVPIIARQIKEEVQIPTNNYILPAGSTVVIVPYEVHRDPEFYGPHPEVFNPDNFLPEKMQNRNYYSFIPFSAGPRSCVGRKYAMLKLKILLSTILRTYKIYSDIPEKDFQLTGDIILKRKEGFQVRIEKRQKVST